MRLVDIAIQYAHIGWHVMPLHTPTKGGCSCGNPKCGKHTGKHPRHGATWQQNASTHRNALLDYWHRWPTANIGIATGARSGIFVLDSDDGGADTIAAHGGVPDTLRARTGSGGEHYYFLHPGYNIPNLTKHLPGIDIRGDGGLIVAAPSRHYSGTVYEWLTPLDTPIAPAPAWLLESLQPHERQRMPKMKADAPIGANDSSTRSGGGEAYALAALGDEAREIRERKEGDRNKRLYDAAQRLGRFVGGGYLDADQIATTLYEAARNSGLESGESYGAIRRGIANGTKYPKEIESNRNPNPPVPPPAPPATPPVAPDEPAHCTDMGNAARFARQHGAHVRYVPKWDKWLLWDGTRWKRDETYQTHRMARTTIRAMYQEAAQKEDTDERKMLARWALNSESRGRIDAMLALARSEPHIPVAVEDLDMDAYLLNCLNGTVDLRTGSLYKHKPLDLITKRIEIAYDKHATCPRWIAFLERIMDGDQELLAYIQRCIGYTLTANTSEQCLFFAYGTGRNGKSTFFEVLMRLLGEYAQKAQTEMIMQSNRDRGVPNDIARLAGARLVVTAEIEEGRRLAESLVKDLTGGDTMTARFLHQEFFDFVPTHKLWIYGNHKPEIRGTDPGIWRRIRVIPFAVQIPVEEIDRDLKNKLIAELPGILAWAVQGCLLHQRESLGEPAAVRQATQEYREQMDVLAAFIAESCVIHPKVRSEPKELYKAYTVWCEDNGERAHTQRRFAQQLNERGIELTRSNGKFWRIGIGLRAEGDSDSPSSNSDPSDPSDPDSDVSGRNGLMSEKHQKSDHLDHSDHSESVDQSEIWDDDPPTAAGSLDDAALAATADTAAAVEDAATAATAEGIVGRLKLRRSSAAYVLPREFLERISAQELADTEREAAQEDDDHA